MNPINIICQILLYDFERNYILKKYFLTKTGTIYQYETDTFKYIDHNIIKTEIGYTGKELLKEYQDECVELFNPQKGIIVIEDHITS